MSCRIFKQPSVSNGQAPVIGYQHVQSLLNTYVSHTPFFTNLSADEEDGSTTIDKLFEIVQTSREKNHKINERQERDTQMGTNLFFAILIPPANKPQRLHLVDDDPVLNTFDDFHLGIVDTVNNFVTTTHLGEKKTSLEFKFQCVLEYVELTGEWIFARAQTLAGYSNPTNEIRTHLLRQIIQSEDLAYLFSGKISTLIAELRKHNEDQITEVQFTQIFDNWKQDMEKNATEPKLGMWQSTIGARHPNKIQYHITKQNMLEKTFVAMFLYMPVQNRDDRRGFVVQEPVAKVMTYNVNEENSDKAMSYQWIQNSTTLNTIMEAAVLHWKQCFYLNG